LHFAVQEFLILTHIAVRNRKYVACILNCDMQQTSLFLKDDIQQTPLLVTAINIKVEYPEMRLPHS
jgi:hypothetical protein